ncbi:histidine phosphatase family protein [Streptococcus sp. H49]|uniref:histidine phosphatase family protein n=1 Tax=Streptococcus huangxiaojuni TaxID=3237239 RepID=UPI0034A1EA70
MKTLYLMRHGETLFNQLQLIQGWCDSPLTEQGRIQAQQAGAYFEEKGIHFNYLYSSTSERACETLELVSKRSDYKRLKGLKEFNFGRMEGKPEYLHPNRRPGQKGHGDFYLQYDGESDSQLEKRVKETIVKLVDEAEAGASILAVSHAGAIMSFYRQSDVPASFDLPLSNCSILKYEIREKQFTLAELIDPVHQKQWFF